MEQPEDDTSEPGGGLSAEQLRSYLSFAQRALRAHPVAGLAVFVLGAALSIAIGVYIPRTYVCKTALVAQGGTVLDRSDAPNALSGAEDLILRHGNLEAIVRDIGLVHNFEQRRPPLLRLKDRIVAALFGQLDEKTRIASLVGTLDTKIVVELEKNTLSITVSWSDGKTAAELAVAARESFLKSRHSAEISAFEDKLAILDGHATRLRDDVTALADQMNNESDSKAKQAGTAATPAATPRVRAAGVAATRGPDTMITEQLSTFKEKLATDKPQLAALESEWQRRLRQEQDKLDELKLRLTANHPEVLTQQERVTMAARVPADIADLRAEIATLSEDLKSRELMARPSTAVAALGGSEPIPTAIIQALETDDTDPALRAQLSGALTKYTEVRSEILSERIDLDTAQAAFNHRYQIMLPAEVPQKPSKPNPGLIVGAGLFLSLLLALLLPILAELRKGVIVESWQVEALQLPVLAELHLPPHSD